MRVYWSYILFHKFPVSNVSNSFSPPAQTNSKSIAQFSQYQRQHLLTIKYWFEIAPTHIFVLKHKPTFFMPQKSKRREMAGRKKAIRNEGREQTTPNPLQLYLIAQLQKLCSCCCHLIFFFYRCCIVLRSWPALKSISNLGHASKPP